MKNKVVTRNGIRFNTLKTKRWSL